MIKKIERVLIASLGAVLIHTGVVFMTQALLGSDPLTLFLESLVKNFGLTLGTWNTIVGAVFALVAFICDKKKIGYTTIFYIATSKLIIDGLMKIVLPADNYLIGMLFVVISTLSISLGSALCVSARIGLSFYDAFIYSIVDRFHLNYIIFRYSLEAVLTLAAIILHTFPSIGTLVYLIVMGPCVSAILNVIKGPIRRHFGLKEEY